MLLIDMQHGHFRKKVFTSSLTPPKESGVGVGGGGTAVLIYKNWAIMAHCEKLLDNRFGEI